MKLSDEPCSKSVAKQFITEVEVTVDQSVTQPCNSQTKLVEPKLEMVRAGGLFHGGARFFGGTDTDYQTSVQFGLPGVARS